jgi:hypothetical protein
MPYKNLEDKKERQKQYVIENEERIKQYRKQRYQREKTVKRICLNCGISFKAHPDNVKRGGGKFCSYSCSTSYKNKNMSDQTRKKLSESRMGEKNPQWKGETYFVKCSYCNKWKRIALGELNKNRTGRFYCNGKCQYKHNKGINSFVWQGGKSFEPYCYKFNEDFKERVREFWGRKCGISGITETENGRKLDVHHVNYDKQACCNTTPPLFIAVSRKWNLKMNKNRDYWEEYLTNYIMIWFDGECYL